MMNFQDSGSLTATGLSSKICADTVQRTLGAYVDVFLYVSEDCYNRTFDRDTVIGWSTPSEGWLLQAKKPHILLEDALEALSHTHPTESLLEYTFNSDLKNIHHDSQISQPASNVFLSKKPGSSAFSQPDQPKRTG
jgi:hypothetical protein